MSDKIYCGNGKAVDTKYGKMLRLSFTADDLQKMQKALDGGWVNVNVNKRKEPSKTGMTHYLTVDTWKPEVQKPRPVEEPENSVFEDDLPF